MWYILKALRITFKINLNVRKSLIKGLKALLKVFGNRNFWPSMKLSGIGGHFFFGENMKLKQLNIVVDNNEICLHQENGGSDNFIAITPEMVDLVCNELQILKSNLEAETQERK